MTAVLRPPRTVRPSGTPGTPLAVGNPVSVGNPVYVGRAGTAPLSGVLSLGRMGVLAVVVFFFMLFGVASFHGVVVGEQFEFDRLQRRLDDGLQRAQVLRNEVARLENPDRILAVAEGRLGLVPPGERVHLAIAPPSDPAAVLRPPVGNPFAGGSR